MTDETPQPPADDEQNEEQNDEGYTATPWHFKLLLFALVLYLGYRLVQLIMWLSGRLF